ncbi:MAG: chemotaxis protein CheD [Bacteroidales bacterium]|nr:chemotaxis protein CheD [Bacteroidales bacterium]
MTNDIIKEHFLYPSTLYVKHWPTIIKTVLGSCVAICLWDRVNQFGGMNHYMLPLWNGKELASPKYGNIAITKLIEEMVRLGSTRNNIVAKMFGGGEVIDTNIPSFKIGERNIIIAKEILREEKISILAESIGGKFGRKIQFNTYTGEVLMKYIKKTNGNQ